MSGSPPDDGKPRTLRVVRASRPAVVAGGGKGAPSLAARPEGERVSKLLAQRGLCSRREADSYIEQGLVFVNGRKVTELGTRARSDDEIRLDNTATARQAQRVTILLHKPVGYVSGQAEDGHQPASVLIRPENQYPGRQGKASLRFQPAHLRGLAPAGRLDIDSTGLLVLTQDGRIARQLIGDDSNIEKEYLVRVSGTMVPEGLRLLNHGLSLDGKALRPAKVSWSNEDQLRFVLREGKKRQIRRMCELVGLAVTGLKRVRIGRIPLADLPPGQWRYLHDTEKF
ncbi:MAG: rRNA pseudouridine synthase [Proteobacteria bacterium]|nr:rRNA pseudouridine synthase [Pseudomonadota bacterium]HQR03236.1 pseudouridine synthase [Rhodocyclaceae bacterium]